MKPLIYFSFLLVLFSCQIQKSTNKNESNLIVHNLGSKQLDLLNQIDKYDSINFSKLLIDSIYTPSQKLWNGYLGDEKALLKWFYTDKETKIKHWNNNSKSINSSELTKELTSHALAMYKFTGYQPKGDWYLFYGPSWTNLGGIGDGIMLIDLAHKNNNDQNRIIQVFPHELNHQIYSETLIPEDNIVLNRIIDEGFATYVSYIFNEKKFTIAEELMYSYEEYLFCKENENEILQLLKDNYNKQDESLSRNFAARNYKFKSNYPGAIGYYIGFRIVEEFVKHKGKNSWKQIYTMQPKEVLAKSRILEP